ncbi:MAG: FMN-binding glutamate synthase family protein [Verrucomicrobiales bacterium]|nr:FMN-binding glutamate synthase family protein [Verrucomicrobiales bacterium]
MFWIILIVFLGVLLLGLLIYDLTQRKHAILRNFPLLGHLRYLLEMVGPELRQYIVTDNDSERPFNRDQRRWVYASSKKENNYFGFGTDNDLETSPNYLIVKHSAFPLDTAHAGESGYDADYQIPCAKVLGGERKRKKAFRPRSVINVSGMSFGSLGRTAVEAMNRGCDLAGCLHNTGEGGVSKHHLHGADLVLQIGTAYFACRDAEGKFSMEALIETVEKHPEIKALEIKLSQGAKPGLGGLLPKEKVTAEIADARGIPMGEDCISPASHTEFDDVSGLLDFVEKIADATGLPVGVKSAVGELQFWQDLAKQMAETDRGVDYICIDGGEGGTGAGPLAYTDHVALPFKLGFPRVYGEFVKRGIQEQVVFIGSAKLGFPVPALLAFAMGCDMVNVAREAMLSIGCIQAQRCHSGHCPAGVATHNRWLVRGLDPTLKSVRMANYVVTLRQEVIKLSHTCGVEHPSLITPDHFEILDGNLTGISSETLFPEGGMVPRPSEQERVMAKQLMADIDLVED